MRQASRQVLVAILPPLAVFIASRLFLIRAASWTKNDAWTAGPWGHWDTAHYLQIAEKGYELFRCERLHSPDYDPNWFCGNTGWLPGFPLLIRALNSLGIDRVVAGAGIAAVFALATLILIWNAFLEAKPTTANLLTLALAGFFPGHVYEHAVFPVSMFTFFQVAALHSHVQRRFAVAGVLGGIAAFSYGSGLFLAGVLGLDHLRRLRADGLHAFVHRVLVGPCVVVMGFALAVWVQWRDVGAWNGYFAVQDKYGYGLTPPWRTLAPHFESLFAAHASAPNIQTLFVLVLVLSLVWAATRAPRSESDSVLAVFLVAYWLIPLSLGGNLSLYRAEAVLLSGVPLARKLPVPMLCAVLLAALVISARMALLFFKGTLV